MTNLIIIGVVIILILVGIHSGIKHFKGEGGCCGGGSTVKAKKKRLDKIIRQRTVVVEGMTCDNCKNRVESRLNQLDGVASKVNLKKKTVLVSMEKEVNDEQIKNTIESAGYKVTDIY